MTYNVIVILYTHIICTIIIIQALVMDEGFMERKGGGIHKGLNDLLQDPLISVDNATRTRRQVIKGKFVDEIHAQKKKKKKR